MLGDGVDVLVVMNLVVLVINFGDLKVGGIFIVNEDSFEVKDFKLVSLVVNLFEDIDIDKYCFIKVDMMRMIWEVVKEMGIS